MDDTQHGPHLGLDQDQEVGKWNRAFFTSNRGLKDRAYFECLQERGVRRNHVDAFLQDTESSVPSREVEQARKFLLHAWTREAPLRQEAQAWVDYRRKTTDDCRSNPKWHTPDQLIKILENRV